MKSIKKTVLLALICVFFMAADGIAARPFRVLVVVGDQWKDPASFLVERAAPTGEYSGYFGNPEVYGDNDFHQLMVLLKSWGIPYDVIRLDQQFLDPNMFMGMDGHPLYGTIIWDVNQSEVLLHPDYTIVQRMVIKEGIGLIALSDRISQPEIQEVLGLKYMGAWESSTKMKPVADHFLTEGLSSSFLADASEDADQRYGTHMKRQKVEVLAGVEVLVNQGEWPQVTAKTHASGARTVWIGNDHNSLFDYQDIRTILRRSITWTIGYSLQKTWENELIMIMDDPGGAQNTYLEHWQYPTLTEDQIVKHLIKPLKKHNAVLNINFVPGFVNDEKGIIEPAWTQNYTDEFGVRQDYISGKKGYDKGIALGVFEVMCHGFTHMQPDLLSEPTWFGSAIDEEKAEVGWYREFGDTRRLKEIPAAEQLWRMRTAKQWLIQQFGVVPLEFCAGGNATSLSYFNSTCKQAALAGFGWAGWTQGYCGTDMVIVDWDFLGTLDSPDIVQAPPDAHDFGIARAPEEFTRVFEQYPDGRFMSINEFIGYLHSSNSGVYLKGEKMLTLSVDYDPHYCRHFEASSSTWKLELADWFEKEAGAIRAIKVDGNAIQQSSSEMIIQVPPGSGQHHIEIEF